MLKKVDHITYACAAGTIEKWAWFHIEVEGGVLINRIDDVRPGDPDSSMKIWCIDHGEFGTALIEGIDRAKPSQVSKFVDKHGDHVVQHVAFDTPRRRVHRCVVRLDQCVGTCRHSDGAGDEPGGALNAHA